MHTYKHIHTERRSDEREEGGGARRVGVGLGKIGFQNSFVLPALFLGLNQQQLCASRERILPSH